MAQGGGPAGDPMLTWICSETGSPHAVEKPGANRETAGETVTWKQETQLKLQEDCGGWWFSPLRFQEGLQEYLVD